MRRAMSLRTSTRSAELAISPAAAWGVVASAERGSHWYLDAAPLRFRSGLDRLAGGPSRRPRAPGRTALRVGDRVGLWEVLRADAPTRTLDLVARVRAPGTVRLAVDVDALPEGAREADAARASVVLEIGFEPRGALGGAYLLADLPARELVTELTMLHLLTELGRVSGAEPTGGTGR